MTEPGGIGPVPLAAGTEVETASARGLRLVSPVAHTRGTVLEFEILLGARPLPVMARVSECRPKGALRHSLVTEFLAMSQADQDSLADFLQAVGAASLRVRPRRPV
jgi:hypothetical protein